MSENAAILSSSLLFLREMSVDEREHFLSLQGRTYADSLVRAGLHETYEEALERASTQLKSILEATHEVQHFFSVRLSAQPEQSVGALWWGCRKKDQSVWIYDIEINEAHRRKGYAREALRLLEDWGRARGVPQIALNVFAFNSGAERLYREMGFIEMSKQMRKVLKD